MATSQIPNLNTFRNPRATGRGLGRGRGDDANSANSSVSNDTSTKDKIVQQTDQDASVSRLSAVEVGYLDDPFARGFVAAAPQRRFPIINRGTYVRTKAIDNLVDRFLSADPTTRKQIISLGAGSDTRYFRLMARAPKPLLIYHELDFPANTHQKISIITNSQTINRLIPSPITISSSADALTSPNYHIHPLDLRTLYPPDPALPAPSLLPHIDPCLPTLLISECCLIYLSPTAADAVVNYFAKQLFPPSTPLGLILYEPINPFDAFGKVMVSNLAARGIILQTLRKFGSLNAQRERLRGHGFVSGRGAADVDFLWETGVLGEEKERVGALEMVDEVEEWRLLAGHYCVVWGWRDGGSEGMGTWEGWRDVMG